MADGSGWPRRLRAVNAEQALIDLYRQSSARLRLLVRRALRSGQIGTAVYRLRQLQAVERELRTLGQRTGPLARDLALEAYGAGARVVEIVQAEVATAEQAAAVGFDFTGNHRRAAAVFADNIANRVGGAAELVGRRTDDAFRRVALEEAAQGVVGGSTRREVSASIERRLVREGVTDALTGFVDRAGRRWQLDIYAEMVARTTTREAVTAGTRNRWQEVGGDLVTISSHNTSTEICQAYEGNTYSLTGRTPGYDVLDQEPPFHPNCLHVMTPGSGGLAGDIDSLIGELLVA